MVRGGISLRIRLSFHDPPGNSAGRQLAHHDLSDQKPRQGGGIRRQLPPAKAPDRCWPKLRGFGHFAASLPPSRGILSYCPHPPRLPPPPRPPHRRPYPPHL